MSHFLPTSSWRVRIFYVFMFVAALLVSVLALIAVVLLEERTLRGPAAKATPAVVPGAMPAE